VISEIVDLRDSDSLCYPSSWISPYIVLFFKSINNLDTLSSVKIFINVRENTKNIYLKYSKILYETAT
jgi:hypothetical protein